jgi:hypothetical protein
LGALHPEETKGLQPKQLRVRPFYLLRPLAHLASALDREAPENPVKINAFAANIAVKLFDHPNPASYNPSSSC